VWVLRAMDAPELGLWLLCVLCFLFMTQWKKDVVCHWIFLALLSFYVVVEFVLTVVDPVGIVVYLPVYHSGYNESVSTSHTGKNVTITFSGSMHDIHYIARGPLIRFTCVLLFVCWFYVIPILPRLRERLSVEGISPFLGEDCTQDERALSLTHEERDTIKELAILKFKADTATIPVSRRSDFLDEINTHIKQRVVEISDLRHQAHATVVSLNDWLKERDNIQFPLMDIPPSVPGAVVRPNRRRLKLTHQ